MFDIGDKVRTSNKVSKQDYETLIDNKLKPGSKGEIVDVQYVVKFGNKIVTLSDNSLNLVEDSYVDTNKDGEITVDFLKNMFGMK